MSKTPTRAPGTSFLRFWEYVVDDSIMGDTWIRKLVNDCSVLEGPRIPGVPARFTYAIAVEPTTDEFLPNSRAAAGSIRIPRGPAEPIEVSTVVKRWGILVRLFYNEDDPRKQIRGDGRRPGLLRFVEMVQSAILREWEYDQAVQSVDCSPVLWIPGKGVAEAQFTAIATVEVYAEAIGLPLTPFVDGSVGLGE